MIKTGKKQPKPEWIRIKLPSGNEWQHVDAILSHYGLHTVCDEARCPNKGECWGCGTATFMILGDTCTRGCRFCAVKTAKSGQPVRQDEPEALAAAVKAMKLSYAVITSVDRDDLPGRGAEHFQRCIAAIKTANPEVKVEVLIPDYHGEELRTVIAACPDVIAHNIETVPRLQHVRDARASFAKSMRTLQEAKNLGAALTKTSILLGMGETREELLSTFQDLRNIDVDILVMGQYLQPTSQELPVFEYIRPEVFNELAEHAKAAGFRNVVSSPFARTSYHAHEASYETSHEASLEASHEASHEASLKAPLIALHEPSLIAKLHASETLP